MAHDFIRLGTLVINLAFVKSIHIVGAETVNVVYSDTDQYDTFEGGDAATLIA